MIENLLWDILLELREINDKLSSKKKKTLPENTGKKWKKDDVEIVKRLWSEGESKKEIAARMKRSPGSIQVVLEKAGLVEVTYHNYIRGGNNE